MSPPQTDVQTKPAPYVIDQVPETAVANKSSTRKTRIIAGTVLLSLLIIGGIVFGAVAYNKRLFYKEEYKAESRFDGDKIPQHIYVDYKNELIYVNNKDAGRIDGMRVLHNYKRKMLAMYDPGCNVCLIDVLDECFDTGLKYWSKYGGIDSSAEKMIFNYTEKPIDPTVLRRFGGEEIVTHCNNGNTTAHWVLSSKPCTGDGEVINDQSGQIEKRSVENRVECKYYWVVYGDRWYLLRICEYAK